MICSKCGHKLIDSKFFCSNCGTFNITKDIFIPFSDAMIDYILIRSPFEEIAEKMRQIFTEFINKISSFDILYSDGYNTFKKYMFMVMNNTVLDILIDKGIDTYSVNMLAEEFADYSIGGSGYKSLKKFVEISELYQQCVNEINTKRGVQRSNRSYWQGGGFGLKGMLSGALTAGMLNLGTEAIRGIGDALTDSSDKKYVDSLMQKHFPTAKKSLIDALYFYICDMAIFVYNIMLREDVFYGQVEFAKNYEVNITDDNEISDKVQTIANNVLKGYQSSRYTKEQAIDKLCQCIKEYPFNFAPYRILYRIERSTKEGIIALGELCGMVDGIKQQVYFVDSGKF